MRDRHRWTIPDRFNLARACVTDWAEATPDAPAVIDLRGARRVWTFADLERASARLAGWLAGRGVGRGDRVALLMPQRAEVIVAHAAIHRLGAVSLPLFALFGPDALAYRLRDAGAVAVIGEAEGLSKLDGLDLPDLRVAVDVDGGLPEGDPRPVADTAAEDPAMMIYTSGTTGDPKGVLHAHRFLWGHLPCIETAYDGFPRPGDVGWTPADWAWIGGLMDLALPCLFHGVPVVAHRMAKFDAGAAWALMARERVTCAFVPPAALRAMRRVDVPDGLALRAVISGGEALGADLLHWARGSLGVPLNEIYGQTEANLVLAACDGTQDRAPGTLGRAVPGVEVEVMGPDGPVADGAVGEIAVRGSPAAFLRYWGKPEETAGKWRGGWLMTGDLGERLGGPPGSPAIRFHARDDDVINSSGYRIGPSEIEACLCAHPAVHAAAVVGLPDERRGEAVTAFVVAEAVGADELIEWVRARLSPHMAPRAVHFRDSLPTTATGKVMRRALRG
ncbi:AMP-binding protein [Jannaschia sp. Os4]|nr:AMP-binding protein [Jannaschia sp. Os4]